AVSGVSGVAARADDDGGVLAGVAEDVPRDCAAGRVSECRDGRRAVADARDGTLRSSLVTVGHSAARDALDRAVDVYRAATPGSAALHRRAAARLPAGVTSNVKFFPPYPVYLSRAEGSRVFDVDGREYIDYCLAFGPLITGHGHPRVMAAVKSELARAGTT